MNNMFVEEKIGFIILNYNTYEMTLKLINNLNKIDTKKMLFLIVVDNCSTNESAKILEQHSKQDGFTLIKNSKNSGYAAGNNIGIQYATKIGLTYSIISNNDIELEDISVIQKMKTLMDSDSKIGAVSPRIIGKDGKKDPPIYFEKPSFFDLSFGIVRFNRKRFSFDESYNRKIYAPRGSFMMLRNHYLKNIGYLDENTFLYYEEPILAERLNKMGAECWICGETQVIHNHGKTISTTIQKKKTADFLCASLDYYLEHYRAYGWIKRKICLLFRRVAFSRRK